MPPMRAGIFTRILAVVLAAGMVAACAGQTVIRSNPPGATVYMNGVPVGRTPYLMKDRKMTGATTTVRLEHPGYLPLDVVITRNEKLDTVALIGGLFFLVPLLWVLEYNPEHHYALNADSQPPMRAGHTPPRQSRLPKITPPRGVQPTGKQPPAGKPNRQLSKKEMMAQARKANELNAEGRDLLRDGKYEAAVAKFEHAIELLEDPRFFFNLCIAHDGAGDKVQAIAACRAVRKLEPSKRLLKKTNEMIKTLKTK